MIKGVMFDFSGTLFRSEPTEDWLRAVVSEAGHDMGEDELAACGARLEEVGAMPGGPPPPRLPPSLTGLWRERDLSAERHRAAYTALARQASLPSPELADALYDRHRMPAAWRPYPDTESTLKELRRRGISVAVVSNIGWDIRPVFRDHGVDHLVTACLLSYEQGTQKPDPVLFQAACDRLDLSPDDVLMVGDDPTADGGAAALGCKVHLVDHLPVDRRLAALSAVLTLLD
ncbi:HAD superfamily hydrolase (TIGR01493 family) [Streptosporangium album]|uniref:HAD superfamily hydrolase (TIGR01493 family) n=1 Tax=Streptosporangium album TaxID=47479 RepID=A0A7W7WBM7_9ACTN|nr:HAD-IA family hydrolase [Streptosporangium album]MBB4940470.1 HAD superfamily hydrolase (TIGR01493 family) [Streptosporangium album]